jgi:hypothetical protein
MPSKNVNSLGNLCDADYAQRDMRVNEMARVPGNGQPGVVSQHYTVGKKGSQAPTSNGKSHSKI